MQIPNTTTRLGRENGKGISKHALWLESSKPMGSECEGHKSAHGWASWSATVLGFR